MADRVVVVAGNVTGAGFEILTVLQTGDMLDGKTVMAANFSTRFRAGGMAIGVVNFTNFTSGY